jgi:hypothetical protein
MGRSKWVQEDTMQPRKDSLLRVRIAIVAFAVALAGCEGTVSVDLGTTAPADPAIAQVLVELDGVQFQKDGGGVESLEFDSPQQVDLMTYLDGNDFRVLTDEQLADGRYTGVRLLFGDDEDDENSVILSDGRDFPLAISGGDAFGDVDFTVDKDNSSNDSVQLTFDLRQSLLFDDGDDDGTVLTPVIRAIRVEDAGGIAGNVTVSCPANSALAIYVFAGDVTPDDRDNADVEPYLTTGVGLNGSSSSSGYAFPFLPEGTYTLASTCRGNDETPTVSEDLNFQNVVTVDVDADATVTRNIP